MSTSPIQTTKATARWACRVWVLNGPAVFRKERTSVDTATVTQWRRWVLCSGSFSSVVVLCAPSVSCWCPAVLYWRSVTLELRVTFRPTWPTTKAAQRGWHQRSLKVLQPPPSQPRVLAWCWNQHQYPRPLSLSVLSACSLDGSTSSCWQHKSIHLSFYLLLYVSIILSISLSAVSIYRSIYLFIS